MLSEPRLYRELAAWWPLFSAPADYAEEAMFFRELLPASDGPDLPTLLELGSGGGNLASHLKAGFRMTLCDRAPGMLAVSRELNRELAPHTRAGACDHRDPPVEALHGW